MAKFSVLQVSLGVSVVVHAALLAWPAVDPEGFTRAFQDTPLEVILVNARSNERPTKAQAIAQHNLAGGGEFDQGRATSPLPSAAVTEIGDAAQDSRKQIEELQEAQQQLLANIKRELAALPQPDPKRDSGNPKERAQEEHRRQLLQMVAEIEKRIREENARPKKKFISPGTVGEVYAVYYDQLRRKVEDRGTRNFPTHQGKPLHGELTMEIIVDAAGRVLETKVIKPSPSPILDKRAISIVLAAAPYGTFSTAMRKQADQLVITTRFRFTKGEALETTLSSTSR